MRNEKHTPYSHQKDTTTFSIANKNCFILNGLGCVDAETEFLSPVGWCKISDWTGQKVAQWNQQTQKISFVEPISYIKKPCNEFISFGDDMMLSAEHRVIGAFKGRMDVRSALEAHIGDKPYLFRSFQAADMPGIPYTDEEIRVMVAYIADGSFIQFNYGKKVCVRLKNESKIERMRFLLIQANIEFKEQHYECDGRTNFIFTPLLEVQEYTPLFYQSTKEQLEIICDEVWRWDGRKKEGRHNYFEFSTMRKTSADFIQYAYSALNHPTSILKSTKKYKYQAKNPRTRQDGEYTTMYIIAASMIKGKMYKAKHSEIVQQGDGFKYCFEVPDTFWVMRRNDVITITGNTGKTLSVLWAADFLLRNKKIKRVLVSSPLSTVGSVWSNEVFFNFKHLKAVVAHGNRDVRIQAIKSNADIVIINHDGLVTMEQELIRAKFDVLIIDELTAFKNHKTDRWKAANQIARKCKAVWGMTAEPTPNSPVEAYAQAKLVNPDNPFLPPLFTKYRDMVEEKITTHLSIPKDGAEKIVHKILQPAIRFERDKCIDIPPCQHIDFEMPLTDQQQEAYEAMRKKFIVEYNEGLITASNAAVKAMKLVQIAAGWVKDDEGKIHVLDSKNRLEELVNIYDNTHHHKLLIFSAFRASVEGINEYFLKKKIKSAFIHGGIAQNTRKTLIERFQNGDLENLIVQPQSTAHGVTLTATDTAIWHSLVASGEIYGQANGRISRIGQTRKQLIMHFLGCAAERRIKKILDHKEDMSRGVLDLFR